MTKQATLNSLRGELFKLLYRWQDAYSITDEELQEVLEEVEEYL